MPVKPSQQTTQVLECVADIKVSCISTRVMNIKTASTILLCSRTLCRMLVLGIIYSLSELFMQCISIEPFILDITNLLLPALHPPTCPFAFSGFSPKLNRDTSWMQPERRMSTHDTGDNIAPLSNHLCCLCGGGWVALHGFKELKKLTCPSRDFLFTSARLFS